MLSSEPVVFGGVALAVLEPLQSALDGGQQLFFDGDLDLEDVGGDGLRWGGGCGTDCDGCATGEDAAF